VGQVFNVGSNEEVSITSLARRIRELTNSRSEIIYVPYDEAYEEGFEDMPRRVPDITKIHDLIGFAPQTPLDSILQQVIEYFSGRQTEAAVSS
jgi:UDP-glucose 4-epimerase